VTDDLSRSRQPAANRDGLHSRITARSGELSNTKQDSCSIGVSHSATSQDERMASLGFTLKTRLTGRRTAGTVKRSRAIAVSASNRGLVGSSPKTRL
jgi:hypothetical protein